MTSSASNSTMRSYDLFLSYNSTDHKVVEEIAHKLAESGLKELSLDRWKFAYWYTLAPSTRKKSPRLQQGFLGLILLDNYDNDWFLVVLGRDENGDFRMIDGETSLSEVEAKTRLNAKLVGYAASGRAIFRRGD